MGYCNTQECDAILAQALTSARPDSTDRFNLINISNVRDFNRIPDETVNYYISLSDSIIDGTLTEMYSTPLKKCANGQWALTTDLDEYNQIVIVEDAANLVNGDEVVLRNEDTGEEEVHIIDEVLSSRSFSTVSAILSNFSTSNTRVFRLQFPPPVNQISARLSAAMIYDKFFSAQNSPNISDYGKRMRKMANGQINDILNGKIILKCQNRIGDRFGNSWIDDAFAHRDRGYSTSDRDISDKGE